MWAACPLGTGSWDDVRDVVRTARTNAKATERLWLDQMKDYIGEGRLKTIDLRPAGRGRWVSWIRWPPSSPFADPATMRMSALLLRGQAMCRSAV